MGRVGFPTCIPALAKSTQFLSMVCAGSIMAAKSNSDPCLRAVALTTVIGIAFFQTTTFPDTGFTAFPTLKYKFIPFSFQTAANIASFYALAEVAAAKNKVRAIAMTVATFTCGFIATVAFVEITWRIFGVILFAGTIYLLLKDP